MSIKSSIYVVKDNGEKVRVGDIETSIFDEQLLLHGDDDKATGMMTIKYKQKSRFIPSNKELISLMKIPRLN